MLSFDDTALFKLRPYRYITWVGDTNCHPQHKDASQLKTFLDHLLSKDTYDESVRISRHLIIIFIILMSVAFAIGICICIAERYVNFFKDFRTAERQQNFAEMTRISSSGHKWWACRTRGYYKTLMDMILEYYPVNNAYAHRRPRKKRLISIKGRKAMYLKRLAKSQRDRSVILELAKQSKESCKQNNVYSQ